MQNGIKGLRSFRKVDDLDALVELSLACEKVEQSGALPTREQIEHQIAIPGFDVESCLFVLPDGDGTLMAVCGAVPVRGTDRYSIQIVLTVRPDQRQSDLGTRLLQFVQGRAADWQKETGRPAHLNASASGKQQYYLDLYTQAGFATARYFLELERDLTQPIEEAPIPNHITVRTMDRERGAAAYHLAFNESFQDHFNPVNLTLEQTTHLIHSPAFQPDLTLLAFGAAGDPAAVCAGHIREGYNARNGTREGTVDVLGVRRPYRKLGLGRAMLTRCMRMLSEQGMTMANLNVDAESPTGATRLYESVGFTERKRSLVLQKSLSLD